MSEHDLVLKGIKIFRQGGWNAFDLAVVGRNLSRIAPAGSEKLEAGKILDFTGRYASPGWIDLHTHLLPLRYGGVGTHAEKIGLKTGVTALLDVGTVGADTFDKFHEKVVQQSATPIFALLNIKRRGIRFWKVGRDEPGEDNIDAMARVVEKYPGIIKGIKITASKEHMLSKDPLYYVRRAREAGDRLQLPLMVHIGQTPPSLTDLLPLLKAGDILTHCFRNGDHAILNPAGKIRPDVLEAKARGVRFDIGHGVKSFSFPVTEKALEQGFDDFTISSDLYMFSTPYRAKNFAHVLSKFLAIGMKLEEVMLRCSTKAAPVLGLERELAEGKPATITVFRIEQGSFRFSDCWNQERAGFQRIIPEAVLLEGAFHPCA
jgi:dihydroorotase